MKMENELPCKEKESVLVIKLHTAVDGSSAAGYNATLRLKKYGVDDVGIFYERKKCGYIPQYRVGQADLL